jgi:hypothetical protein
MSTATPAAGYGPAVRSQSRFYSSMTAALLVTVLVGFTPSLYLRAFFDVPEEAPRVFVHGAFLTAWFVALWAQATLVAAGNVALHRLLGWLVAAIGVGAIVTSLHVTLVRIAADSLLAPTAWSNLTAAVTFAIFLVAAIAMRRDAGTHKRLMLLASIAFIQPAVARILFWSGSASFGVHPFVGAVVIALLFLLPLVAHDLATRRKLHAATLIGGGWFVASKLVAVFVIAGSSWGQSVLREWI